MTSEGADSAPGGKVVAGFFSFTVITDEKAHREYNAWHQLDHLPEQMPLEGIAHGQRWVSTPACHAVTRYGASDRDGAADLSCAQYLTIYLMSPPLDASVKAFYDLARELHGKDRFFPHRRAIAAGPIPVVSTHAAARVSIGAAAVPYRPNRGLYVVVGATDSGRPVEHSVGDLLEVPGVAGIWAFGPSGATPETRTSLAAPAGSERLDEEIVVVYLDDDPLETARRIEEILVPGWESSGLPPRLAGPFETISPWSWDWFEEDRREDRGP